MQKLIMIGLTTLLINQFHSATSWASGTESSGGSAAVDEKKDEDRAEKREELRRKMREKKKKSCDSACAEGEGCCSQKQDSKETNGEKVPTTDKSSETEKKQ